MEAMPAREFIFTSPPFASCHASTVVESPKGDLLVAWFGGSKEGHPDVAIWGARRTGHRWSAPFELVREPEIASYNPVLFYTADQCLWLYYKFGPHPTGWTAGRCYSNDHGQTWSPPEHLPAGVYGPIRAKPLVMEDGTVVSGTSVETYRSWACWIERSTDDGKSWVKLGPITVSPDLKRSAVRGHAPPDVPGSSEWVHTDGIIQPSVVGLGDQRLRLYARSTVGTARICVADSTDGGLSWSQARPIDLPNPNSGIDAVALSDGRVVLVYNHSDSGRTPLNLAVSTDGERFQMFGVFEDEREEYSYPAVIQGGDGDLHISYTWKRARICYVRLPLSVVPD